MSNVYIKMSSVVFNSPVTHQISKTIASYDVEITRLILFSSVDLLVTLKDENGAYVCHRIYQLTGTDYSNWSADDSYIMAYIDTKLHADSSLTFV